MVTKPILNLKELVSTFPRQLARFPFLDETSGLKIKHMKHTITIPSSVPNNNNRKHSMLAG